MARGFSKQQKKQKKKHKSQVKVAKLTEEKILFQSALAAYQAKELNRAKQSCQELLKIEPNCESAWFLWGSIEREQGDLSQAIIIYEKLLQIQPKNFSVLSNLGVLYIQQKQVEKAITCFTQAIEVNPNYAQAYSNLGQLYQDCGQTETAQKYLEQAITLDPKDATGHYNLGNVYKHQGNLSLAIARYQTAIELNPHRSDIYNNLGNTYLAKGETGLAFECYQKALQLQPNNGDAYNNLGNIYFERRDLSQAVKLYKHSAKLKSEDAIAEHNLLFALHYSSNFSPQEIFLNHRNWGSKYLAISDAEIKPHQNSLAPDRTLKIGYVSGDFKTHSVSYFFEPLLLYRDRHNFEITCYANNHYQDQVTEKFKSLTDNWRDIAHLEDTAVVELIRQDEIDILVDLAGHTLDNRLSVFARKPAPLQATYLGYPNTTGLETIDYRFTDAVADPLGMTEAWHTEELLRLPDSFLCYQPSSDTPEVNSLPAISKGNVTFGSFNTLPKISQEIIECWVKILRQVPNSRLLIKAKSLKDQGAKERIYQLFTSAGIERDRIDLRGWVAEVNHHLSLYNEIDIALDTYPYHGTTTTCEALYMGIPVVTLAGESHVSRVGVSLLSSLGLNEFITNNQAEYINKAVEIASNLPCLAELRENLRLRLLDSPLTDGKAIARNIESAYRQIWHKLCHKNELNSDLHQAFKYYHQGDLAKSREFLESNLNYSPEISKKPEFWHLLGSIYHQENKINLAIDAYEKLIQLRPDASLMSNLGVLYIQQKQIDQAIVTLKKAITLDPQYLQAYNNLGELYREQQQYSEAKQYFQQGIKIQPDYAAFHRNLGIVYRQEKNYPQAIASLLQAIKYQPHHAKTHSNLGFIYHQQGQTIQAEKSYQRAIELDSQSEVIYFDLGNFYKDLGKLMLAENAYQQAIKLKPDYQAAYNNLGCLYRDYGRVEESLTVLRQAIELDPNLTAAYHNLLFYLHYNCQFSPTEIYHKHLRWSKTLSLQSFTNLTSHNQLNTARNLRIGYLSGDFRTHSVAYFLEPILTHHNLEEFTIYCYSNNPLDDQTTDRFKQLISTWRDIQQLDDQTVAKLIQEDEIDILVDLAGHTGGNRLKVLARKPAPIQITYLGYPNTTGLSTIQYRFTDADADPIGKTENLHVEQLIRLPNTFLCYQPPDNTPPVNNLPVKEKGYFTFGSFNSVAKISDLTVNCWLKIMQALPNSHLILKSKGFQDQDNCDRISNLFTSAGIESERLEFRGWTKSIAEHFALYQKVDLALDTYPYHGTTTTCEALWMGVPVITLAGESHVSRVGVSLLSSVGLNEFITNNQAEYINKAVEIASNLPYLAELSENLRSRLLDSPLTDGKAIARNIESAYRQIWHKLCHKIDILPSRDARDS